MWALCNLLFIGIIGIKTQEIVNVSMKVYNLKSIKEIIIENDFGDISIGRYKLYFIALSRCLFKIIY